MLIFRGVNEFHTSPLFFVYKKTCFNFKGGIKTSLADCWWVNCCITKNHGQNIFFGLVEGFCIMTGGCAVGSVSGGMMNPAVAVAWLKLLGVGGP